jgi:hypothetical protein
MRLAMSTITLMTIITEAALKRLQGKKTVEQD